MAMVKVRCKESRFVGFDKYQAGKEYTMDAERAGKYHECFSPVGRDDDEAVAKAWGARQALVAQEQAARRVLSDYDPSILAAAARLIQEAASKRLTAGVKEVA